MQLNYSFKNQLLLEEALTHPSLCKNNDIASYERLEFLGDSVIGLYVAEMVYSLLPNASEGELSITHSMLIGTKTLAEIANELGLSKTIKMDTGEEKNGGRTNPNNLENALEALMGALYLDAGPEITRELVQTLWQDKLTDLNIEAIKSPKSVLQEWAQKGGKPIPAYKVTKQEGSSHEPQFTVALSVEGLDTVEAYGKSKKEAEVSAARIMLNQVKEV